MAVYARPFHEESGRRSPANWLKLPRLWDKRTPSWAGMIRDDWLWWKHGGLMSCYFCLGQIWVMIQHWKAYFSTSQPERCDYLCLVLTADPSTKLWGELTWINDPSSRVGWSQHVTVGHPELPGGRLPFRAPHRCLWRRLFDQCWDLALDLFVGGQGHAGACRGMQGHRGGFQHLRFPMRFNELKLANYIIVDFLNLPIHLLVILFSLDIDLSVGRFFRLHGGNC